MTRSVFFATAALLLVSSHAFAPLPSQGLTKAPTTSVSMGLLDFFSEDSRKEREERRQREIEEQEKLQRQIRERRMDPEKMEEYQARVALRRRAIMDGKDASSVTVMVDYDDE